MRALLPLVYQGTRVGERPSRSVPRCSYLSLVFATADEERIRHGLATPRDLSATESAHDLRHSGDRTRLSSERARNPHWAHHPHGSPSHGGHASGGAREQSPRHLAALSAHEEPGHGARVAHGQAHVHGGPSRLAVPHGPTDDTGASGSSPNESRGADSGVGSGSGLGREDVLGGLPELGERIGLLGNPHMVATASMPQVTRVCNGMAQERPSGETSVRWRTS